MVYVLLLFIAQVAPAAQTSRPLDIAFRVHMVDPGFSESVAVADFNKDGIEQTPDGQWTRRIIDSTWANAHSSAMADVNGDGQPDLVTAKRYFGRTGNDPAEREPMGIYWYQFRAGPKGSVEWVRHIVDYGGRAGGGLQMIVEDLDGDGDRDVVTAGKTGLFLSENLTKASKTGRMPHD